MGEYYHVVPWYDSKEWQQVYEDISNTNSSKEHALKTLLVWKVRSPSLPSGIESTLSLLQVFVEDANTSQNASDDQLLRLAYSSAIMRFVNHMLDTETVKGASLYKAAKRLGVPDWIVDLRHDTAHNNTLPPIALLREACAISLEWLKTNYWDKHVEFIEDYVCGQQNNAINGDAYKIGTLINFCISLGICSHSKLKIKNLSEIPDETMRESIVADAEELLGDHIDLSNLETVSIKSIINVLNTHGKKLLKVRDVSTVVNDALLGDDGLFLSKDLLFFFSASDFKYRNKLYNSYVHCFEVLLTFLHTNDLLLDFIMALIKITQTREGGHFRARLSALWLAEIFAALKISQNILKKMRKMTDIDIPKKRKHLKELYEKFYPDSRLENVLVLDLKKPVPEELQDITYIQPIIAAYNHYLSYFISHMLVLLVPNLPAMVAERICTLAKLISSPEKFPMTPSATIYTVEDLEMANNDDIIIIDQDTNISNNDDVMIIENVDVLEVNAGKDNGKVEQKDNAKQQQQMVIGVWRLASNEHDWSTCPIGRLPWKHSTENVVEMETN